MVEGDDRALGEGRGLCGVAHQGVHRAVPFGVCDVAVSPGRSVLFSAVASVVQAEVMAVACELRACVVRRMG